MSLSGKRILVVEDDYFIARDLCDLLDQRGATVLGPAPTPFYATQLLRRPLDGAILDIRLHGTEVYELATQLLSNDTPIVFATAIAPEQIPAGFASVIRVGKPYSVDEVANRLTEAMERPAMSVAPTLARPAENDIDAALMRAVVKAIQHVNT